MATHVDPPDRFVVAQNVAVAFAEDVRDGDVTAMLVPDGTVSGHVLCRDSAILAGRPWFDEAMRQMHEAIEVHWLVAEGQAVTANQKVCTFSGPAAPLLTGERTALNFLQLLSGVATATRACVDAVAGTAACILDTRKTLPGLRVAQKYAVRCGGGTNHRIGLYDAFLIKENHISAAGSIAAAVAAARECRPELLLEVEVESMVQLDEAVAAGADRIMLDNFSLADTQRAVQRVAGRSRLEASGGIRLEDLAPLAATGVDFISIGSLTKHVRATDFSMRFDE